MIPRRGNFDIDAKINAFSPFAEIDRPKAESPDPGIYLGIILFEMLMMEFLNQIPSGGRLKICTIFCQRLAKTLQCSFLELF